MAFKNKTHTKSTKTEHILVFVGLFAVLWFAYGIFARSNDWWPFATSQKTKIGQEELRANNESKQNFIENSDIPLPTDSSKTSEGYVNQSKTSDITILASQNGRSATIRTRISGISAGNCNLNITNGSLVYTNQAPLVYQAEYSSCAGFSVPVNELGTGTWNINISVNTDTKASIIFEVK